MGSTLWTSPQTAWGWPPPTAVDSDDFTATIDEVTGTITMSQPEVTPSVGPNVRVTKAYKANLCKEAIDITYTVTNGGTSALSAPLAAWEVTRVLPGGLMFFPPINASATPDTRFSPASATNATVITVTTQNSWWWYANPVTSTEGSKLFADGTGGWLALTDGTNLFVKQWTDVPATSQISGEAEVEIYNGNTYVEIENQGPSVTLTGTPPGNSTTFQMRWYVRPLPSTAQKTAGNQALIDAATALMQ
jgi:hypothetical protein